MLKERKKLILVVRETPFSTIHLKNMLSLSEAGAVILPAIPAFYHKPQTIQDQIDFISGKTLDSFGIDSDLFKDGDKEFFAKMIFAKCLILKISFTLILEPQV